MYMSSNGEFGRHTTRSNDDILLIEGSLPRPEKVDLKLALAESCLLEVGLFGVGNLKIEVMSVAITGPFHGSFQIPTSLKF